MRILITIGDREYPIEGSFNGYFEYCSYAHTCPLCLRVWARVQVDSDLVFEAETSPCERCPWPWSSLPGIPGSLLRPGVYHRLSYSDLDYLPLPLIEREFSLHLKHLGIPLERSDKDKYFDDIAQRHWRALCDHSADFERIAADVLNRGALPPLRR